VKAHRLETSQVFAAGLDRTFAFFADAANLERITPPFLRFRVLTPLPMAMGEGARLTYALRLHGVPIRWVTCIDAWEPGRRFVDRQLSGPYALWVHEHTFEPVADGTLVRDRVDYALPFDPWSRPAHALLVRPDVEKIFAYRRRVMAEILGGPAEAPAR